MTTLQEVKSKIDQLPDENINVLLATVNEMLRQKQKKKVSQSSEKKKKAFLEILELAKEDPFPADFDYDKARKEALSIKYGNFD